MTSINTPKIEHDNLTNLTNTATYIFALGGLEEIGKNMYCFEQANEIIVIDVGIKFVDSASFAADLIVPDFSYLIRNKEKIKAIFITHGHEDHIGGVPYLLKALDIPFIYAPRLAAELIRDKLHKFKIKTDTKIVEIDATTNQNFNTKHFKIEYFQINHSIPDSYGIMIETINGIIVSTGDFKFDWTPLTNERVDLQKLINYGKRGTTLLLSDSTNSIKETVTQTEQIVIQNLDKLFLQIEGRILISMFASNIHRIRETIMVAIKHKRKIFILGRSLENIIKIMRKMPNVKIPDNAFDAIGNINNYNVNEIMIICTGSQGEPLAALTRLSKNENKLLSIIEGDTVIFSSSPIPENIYKVSESMNKLNKLGAIVKKNSSECLLHVSGHAGKEGQKIMLSIVKPTYFMPMHGYYRMMKEHCKTAVATGVKSENLLMLKNGDRVEMIKGKIKLTTPVISGGIYIANDFSNMLVSRAHSNLVNFRMTIAKKGIVQITLFLHNNLYKMFMEPKITLIGIKKPVKICNLTIQQLVAEYLKQNQPINLSDEERIVFIPLLKTNLKNLLVTYLKTINDLSIIHLVVLILKKRF